MKCGDPGHRFFAVTRSLECVFDALPEQLRLRLEMKGGPMNVIVVDAANPTPKPD
jgi:uncharacterized protein (TIGR03435 family)